MYTRVRLLVRRYLAQFPQGRKAARVSELFRVREGPFSFGASDEEQNLLPGRCDQQESVGGLQYS